MAGRIRDEDIATVRERSPVDEVIGEYLQLRNAGGGSVKGLCPFHDEKTPSFNVTPSRGLWYCHGCAEGGDVIKFVQKIDALSFAEAIEKLAGRAGMELRYEQGGYVPGQEHGQRRRLVDAHRMAAEFFAEKLNSPEAEHAGKFLTDRGFEAKDAERFGVGYSPASWEDLTKHLRGRGFSDPELLTSGLATQGKRGPMDRFRNRLMWPIRELSGDVIAFGARKLNPDEDGPKYLNTPETPLFRKSTVLYGADLAKREIAQRRQAVIVEGYTDVMAGHLRHVVRRRAHQGAPPAHHGYRVVAGRGDLHLRRRRGRPAGGTARVRHGGEVRHADLRHRAARRAGPVRRPPGARGRRGAGSDRPPRAAIQVRHPRRAGQPQPGYHRGPAGRA